MKDSNPTNSPLTLSAICLGLRFGVVLALGSSGCVAMDGGAVEAGWVINSGGRAVRINCRCAQIEAVRLVLTPLENPTAQDPCQFIEGRCQFDCPQAVGSTRFEIPEGTYAMSVSPVGLDGELVGRAEHLAFPPPVERTVRYGKLTDLGVNLFIAEYPRLAAAPDCEAEWLEAAQDR